MREIFDDVLIDELDELVQLPAEEFNHLFATLELMMTDYPCPDVGWRLGHLLLLQAHFERTVNLIRPGREDHCLDLRLIDMAAQMLDNISHYFHIYAGVLNGYYDGIDIDWGGEPVISDTETETDSEYDENDGDHFSPWTFGA